MKKYLKKQAATFKYVFISPWKVHVEQHVQGNYVDDTTSYDIDPQEAEEQGSDSDIAQVFNEAWSEDGETVAQFLYERKGIMSEINCELSNKGLITTVITKQELSKEQIDNVIDYMEGQFADGFGEGLEQQEAARLTEDGDEDGNYPRVQDYISYEEWADNEGIEPFEDDMSEEAQEAYDRFDEATDEEVTTTRSYFINLWPNNFKMELQSQSEI